MSPEELHSAFAPFAPFALGLAVPSVLAPLVIVLEKLVRLFPGPADRAAKRVQRALSVREALESSLRGSAEISSIDALASSQKALLDADRAIVREALLFGEIIDSDWRPRPRRPKILLSIAAFLVVAFVIWRSLMPDVPHQVLVAQIVTYIAGCVLAGAGVLDLRLGLRAKETNVTLGKIGLDTAR